MPNAPLSYDTSYIRTTASKQWVDTQTSSRMPRAIQASGGNAPKDATFPLILSNMKSFM